MKAILFSVFVAAAIVPNAGSVRAQGGVHTLFGDVHVDEGGTSGSKPLVYEIVLYNSGEKVVARQFVNGGGRYRFLNIANGQFYVAVFLENEEIGRIRVEILAPFKNDFRQDLYLQWRSRSGATSPGSISLADFYQRTTRNHRLFEKAKKATDKRNFAEAINHLRELLSADAKDFQAWVELGTNYLFVQDYGEAEKAYLQSVTIRPSYFLAQLNLGKVRVSRGFNQEAVQPLTQALRLRPTSADANYYLGEALLQLKKGSQAVGYFHAALRLDPVGKAEAHLRLALLYHAAGLRQKAAAEYAAFLRKKPDFSDRRALEDYITANNRM